MPGARHRRVAAATLLACLVCAVLIAPVAASGHSAPIAAACTELPGNNPFGGNATPCAVGDLVGGCTYSGHPCDNGRYITCTRSPELGVIPPVSAVNQDVQNPHKTVRCETRHGATILKAYWFSGCNDTTYHYSPIRHGAHRLKTTLRPGNQELCKGVWGVYVEAQR